MSASTLVPLTLERIEGGLFLDAGDRAFEAVQAAMSRYVQEHKGGAKGASASITMKVDIKCTDPETGSFDVCTSLKSTAPARPKRVSMALQDLPRDILVCQSTGSDEDEPRQTKIDFARAPIEGAAEIAESEESAT